MSDLKPGDEVVCVRGMPGLGLFSRGQYIVAYVGAGRTPGPWVGVHGVLCSEGRLGLWCPSRFRKVQRRDLQSWLKTSVPSTDHLDKPLPAKKRERVE